MTPFLVNSMRTLCAASVWLLLLLAGCVSPFNTGSAREVTRDRLLALADEGAANHMEYRGSDRVYHYVYDNREDRKRTYKIRADQFQLRDTFEVGEDSYVLHPWLIDGKLMGTQPD